MSKKDKAFIEKIKTLSINTGSGKKVKHAPGCLLDPANAGKEYECKLIGVIRSERPGTEEEQSFSE